MRKTRVRKLKEEFIQKFKKTPTKSEFRRVKKNYNHKINQS